jgi:hypothetical protein
MFAATPFGVFQMLPVAAPQAPDTVFTKQDVSHSTLARYPPACPPRPLRPCCTALSPANAYRGVCEHFQVVAGRCDARSLKNI